MGYREWQTYEDRASGMKLAVAQRRTPKRYLEDVILTDPRHGLVGWQLLDAQPSALSGGLLTGGQGLVAHLLGSTDEGPCEGWYAVATGDLEGLPHYVWAGAWLGAQARPGHPEVLQALAYVVKGARAEGEASGGLADMITAARAALRDLLKAGPGAPDTERSRR